MQLIYDIVDGHLKPGNSCCEAWTQKKEGQRVVVEPLTPAKVRSLESNSLYWTWVRQVADEQGESSAYIHSYHKYYFGLAILAEETPDKYDMLRRWLGQLALDQRLEQMHLIVCTSEFNQSQMNRFMETVQRHWAERGIILD